MNGCLCGAKERMKLRGETGGEINRRPGYRHRKKGDIQRGKQENRREKLQLEWGRRIQRGGRANGARGEGGFIGKTRRAAENPRVSSVPRLVPGGERSLPHRLHHCCFHNRVPGQQPQHYAT